MLRCAAPVCLVQGNMNKLYFAALLRCALGLTGIFPRHVTIDNANLML